MPISTEMAMEVGSCFLPARRGYIHTHTHTRINTLHPTRNKNLLEGRTCANAHSCFALLYNVVDKQSFCS